MSRKPPVVVILKSAPLPPRREQLPSDRYDYTPKQKPNPLHAAAVWLGSRLEERQNGFFLDGVPASLDTIMRATNRVLVSQGIEQITASDRWRVPESE